MVTRVIAVQSPDQDSESHYLRCTNCGAVVSGVMAYRCPDCSGVLQVDTRPTLSQWEEVERARVGGSQWSYSPRLPVGANSSPVTLGEGDTALLEAHPALAGRTFEGRLLLKDETTNPTGSFKDRFVSVAITRAMADGCGAVVCASSGNAGAAAAAYAARAGIPAVVCVPETAPPTKFAQARAYGAQIVAVRGTYSDAYMVADRLQRSGRFVNVTTTYHNPYGVAALRTVGYELLDAMDNETPRAVFVPTGAGPLVRGIQWAYEEALQLGVASDVPAMVAVQAEGCAPIVQAYEAGWREVRPWTQPATIASGIADPLQGYEQDGSYTLAIVRDTGGQAVAANDEQIQSAADDLATKAGIFAELTGAVGLAGLRALVASDRIERTATVVVIITGSGFKDLQARSSPLTAVLPYDPRSGDIEALASLIDSARSTTDTDHHFGGLENNE